MQIQIQNRPRRTGKTTELKLRALECANRRENILFLVSNKNQEDEFERYFEQFKSQTGHIGVLCPTNNMLISRGVIPYRYSMIFIDEPFMLSDVLQDYIINFANEMKIDILGLGTLKYKSKKFEDYL